MFREIQNRTLPQPPSVGVPAQEECLINRIARLQDTALEIDYLAACVVEVLMTGSESPPAAAVEFPCSSRLAGRVSEIDDRLRNVAARLRSALEEMRG